MTKYRHLVVFILLFALSQAVAFSLAKNITIINDKMFFGLYESNVLSIIILVTFSFLLFLYLFKSTNKYKYPSIIVLSGTFSNLFDRIIFGGVRDYIKIQYWPIFNLADVLIILGIFFFCYQFFKESN